MKESVEVFKGENLDIPPATDVTDTRSDPVLNVRTCGRCLFTHRAYSHSPSLNYIIHLSIKFTADDSDFWNNVGTKQLSIRNLRCNDRNGFIVFHMLNTARDCAESFLLLSPE